MSREAHVRICGGREGQFLPATRLGNQGVTEDIACSNRPTVISNDPFRGDDPRINSGDVAVLHALHRPSARCGTARRPLVLAHVRPGVCQRCHASLDPSPTYSSPTSPEPSSVTVGSCGAIPAGHARKAFLAGVAVERDLQQDKGLFSHSKRIWSRRHAVRFRLSIVKPA